VQEQIFDLMYNLGATEDQLDFPTVYGSAKNGWMSIDGWTEPTGTVKPLLDSIIEHIPEAPHNEGPLQMQITSLDYSSFVGRIAIGRVFRGVINQGEDVLLLSREHAPKKSRVKELFVFTGLGKEKVEQVRSGDICAIVGMDNFEIGDTIADTEHPEALERIAIDEPTMSMLFTINNSPFFGQEGKFVTSRNLRDRLFKETEKNVALLVEETSVADSFIVFGRGILHLSILVETMRREGYEFQLGQPQVIVKTIDGIKHEPVEALTIQVPEEFSGKMIEVVTQRKGEIVNIEVKGDRSHLEFIIPSRGIIGLRNQLLTLSEGEAVIAHRFLRYEPWKGELGIRRNGALIALETGTAIAYSIDKLQDRGKFFVEPGDEVYAGMVIGEHIRQNDLTVNVIKTKKLTNMRASGSDEKMNIAPAVKFSLEEYMEYIRVDEYLEVTPTKLRLRKIILNELERKRLRNANS
jgi:GTP-binding protein